MNALLTKDLRLSLDVLRPWAIVVVGLALGVFILSRAPESLLPDALRAISIGELFVFVAGVVGFTAVIVSAWSAASIAQGDRTHGAAMLAAALPIAPSHRALSKATALLPATLAPPLVVCALYTLGRQLGYAPNDFSVGVVTGLVAAASAVGAGLALGVAPLIRSRFQTVAVALLVGLAGGMLGVLGAWIGLRFFSGELARVIAAKGWIDPLPQIQVRLDWISGVTGVGAAAIGCALVGVVSLARLRTRRSLLYGVSSALALSLVAGVVATKPALATDQTLKDGDTYLRLVAILVSSDEIVEAIPRYFIQIRDARVGDGYQRNQMLVWEGMYRMRALPPAQRIAHPITLA